MKVTKRNIRTTGIICAVVLVAVAVYIVFFLNFTKLSSGKVKSITLSAYTTIDKEYLSITNQELNAQDVETFIKLFNESEYIGKREGEFVTAEYWVIVKYTDGREYRIYEDEGYSLEVNVYKFFGIDKKRFYIKSRDLRDFINQMIVEYSK